MEEYYQSIYEDNQETGYYFEEEYNEGNYEDYETKNKRIEKEIKEKYPESLLKEITKFSCGEVDSFLFHIGVGTQRIEGKACSLLFKKKYDEAFYFVKILAEFDHYDWQFVYAEMLYNREILNSNPDFTLVKFFFESAKKGITVSESGCFSERSFFKLCFFFSDIFSLHSFDFRHFKNNWNRALSFCCKNTDINKNIPFDFLSLCITKGANNFEGPLFISFYNKNFELLEFLLQNKANPNICKDTRSKENILPIDFACETSDLRLIIFLLFFGSSFPSFSYFSLNTNISSIFSDYSNQKLWSKIRNKYFPLLLQPLLFSFLLSTKTFLRSSKIIIQREILFSIFQIYVSNIIKENKEKNFLFQKINFNK